MERRSVLSQGLELRERAAATAQVKSATRRSEAEDPGRNHQRVRQRSLGIHPRKRLS